MIVSVTSPTPHLSLFSNASKFFFPPKEGDSNASAVLKSRSRPHLSNEDFFLYEWIHLILEVFWNASLNGVQVYHISKDLLHD